METAKVDLLPLLPRPSDQIIAKRCSSRDSYRKNGERRRNVSGYPDFGCNLFVSLWN